VVLSIFVLMPWTLLTSSPALETIRRVDICLIMASGMALGALIAHVARLLRGDAK
jgi:uncharacterized protein YoaH (UPF0181 family)